MSHKPAGMFKTLFGVLLFSLVPGLMLFDINEAMFMVVRHESLPIMSAVLYVATFFALAAIGSFLAGMLASGLGRENSLKALVLSGAGLMALEIGFYLYRAIASAKLPVFSKYHVMWFGELAALAVVYYLFSKKKPGKLFIFFIVSAILVLSCAWALVFPDEVTAGEPYSYLLNAANLILLTALAFNLWRDNFALKAGQGVVALLTACLIVLVLLSPLFQSENPGTPAGEAENAAGVSRPNIVFIVMDTARKDRLSLYGYQRDTSRSLNRLAQESVVYTNAVSVASWTPPSHASMFTGLYPRNHGMHSPMGGTGQEQDFASLRLSDESVTMAEILSEHGYITGAVSANFGWVGPIGNLNQGFDFFDNARNHNYLDRHFELQNKLLQIVVPYLSPGARFEYLNPTRPAESINKSALKWVGSLGKRTPFFLFINYMDAHEPYFPKAEYVDLYPGYSGRIANLPFYEVLEKNGKFTEEQQAHIDSQYDADIFYLDKQLGRLFDALKKMGLYDSSYIIVTSDHGQALGERGEVGHGKNLHAEMLDIPLVIKYPGESKRGVEKARIENRALFFMVLEQAGIKVEKTDYPWGALSELYSAKKLKNGPDDNVRESQKVHTGAVYFGRYKYMCAMGDSKCKVGDSEALYDVSQDPHETNNLLTVLPEQTAKGRELIREFLDTVPEVGPGKATKKMTPEEMEKLRALGYIK